MIRSQFCVVRTASLWWPANMLLDCIAKIRAICIFSTFWLSIYIYNTFRIWTHKMCITWIPGSLISSIVQNAVMTKWYKEELWLQCINNWVTSILQWNIQKGHCVFLTDLFYFPSDIEQQIFLRDIDTTGAFIYGEYEKVKCCCWKWMTDQLCSIPLSWLSCFTEMRQ